MDCKQDHVPMTAAVWFHNVKTIEEWEDQIGSCPFSANTTGEEMTGVVERLREDCKKELENAEKDTDDPNHGYCFTTMTSRDIAMYAYKIWCAESPNAGDALCVYVV